MREPRRKPTDWTGVVQGLLTVIGFHGHKRFPSGQSMRLWDCLCQCGKTVVLAATQLRGGQQTCGCYFKNKGQSDWEEYHVWQGIHDRCNNRKNRSYNNYGGRGICVCETWGLFENFIKDMGRRPAGDYTLERKDNDGNYSPDNCRWATRAEQNLNKRDTVWIEFQGRRMILLDWATELGIPASLLYSRRTNGWPVEAMLTYPLGKVFKVRKLSDAQIAEIRQSTLPQKELAQQYGVAQASINRIINRKRRP